MFKIDLHTHSIISPDGAGSIKENDFKKFLEKGILDCIAITDHNETSFAIELRKKLGDKIIVGEEITTKDGEMIGLFLNKTIPAGLSAKQTVREIKKQNGLIYIPHPFETFRKGVKRKILEEIINDIDIFEVFNGRGVLRGKAKLALEFAEKYNLPQASSSDAHGHGGIGRTYSIVSKMPTRNNIKQLLSSGKLQRNYAPIWTYLYPVTNMIKTKLRIKK